jgi:hypothetical protein
MHPRDPSNNPRELRLDSLQRLKVGGGYLSSVAVSILAGASLTAPVALGDSRAVRIIMPADWTAADITFQTSYDGVAPYQDLYDAFGAVYTVKAAAARGIILPVTDFFGVGWLKIRSGTPIAPVPQVGQRDLVLQLVGA